MRGGEWHQDAMALSSGRLYFQTLCGTCASEAANCPQVSTQLIRTNPDAVTFSSVRTAHDT
eukprot:1001852-Heterocapsa_arctica.AAC.1